MPFGDKRGLTLLEAVVALAILGVVGVAALATVGAELRGAARARRAVEATALAEEEMRQLSLLPADSLSPLPSALKRGTFTGALSDYTWDAKTRAVPDQPDTYAVTVTITWPEGGSYMLSTRAYRPVATRAAP
jgi:prepilin-type N-terminal cleavage/methylation domain-containing protein